MTSTMRTLAVGLVAAASALAAEAQAQTPYDTSNNFAYVGNGAAVAVSSSDLGIPPHSTAGANDGLYGNASSWIPATIQFSWLKVDLGQVRTVSKFRGGRDREGVFNDRWWNDYQVLVALTDNVYADGDDSNDAAEYTLVASGFFGAHAAGASTEVEFAPVQARYVKLVILNTNPDALDEPAVDEIEVEGVDETPCGDGIVDVGEQCDDGNQVGGDCCSATCQNEPDGNACIGGTCSGGICVGASNEHYACYQAKAADDGLRPDPKPSGTLTDQVASSNFEKCKFKFLCVPAEKNGSGPPENPDLAYCGWQCKGFKGEVPFTVTDQFGSGGIVARKLKFILNECSISP